MNTPSIDTQHSSRAADIARTINSRLETALPFLPPLAMALGFLFPDELGRLKPFVPWLFGLMTLTGALRLRARELGAALLRPVPMLAFFLGSHLIMPLAALALSSIALPGKADLIAGFVLVFATPTAVSGFIWVTIFGGDAALSLAIILLDSLLSPLITPLTMSLLLRSEIAINGAGLVVSLLAMVVTPTVLGVAINEASRGRIPARAGPYLGPLSKLCLILVISGNLAAIAPSIDFGSPVVALTAGLCVVLAVAGFSLGRLLGAFPGLNDAAKRSLTLNVGFRNTNVAATLAIAFFPQTTALPATLGVLVQQTTAAIMGRVLLGRPESEQRRP